MPYTFVLVLSAAVLVLDGQLGMALRSLDYGHAPKNRGTLAVQPGQIDRFEYEYEKSE